MNSIKLLPRLQWIDTFRLDGAKAMSPVKESVIRLVESLPDDCTVEDIQYHLYVREKVLAGSRAIDEGRTQSHEEVGRRLDEWAASFGLTRRQMISLGSWITSHVILRVRIIYEIRGEACYIVAVIHGSRDLPRHIRPPPAVGGSG